MKPSVLVTRAIYPEVIAHLAQYFDVDDNQQDAVLDAAALKARLAGKAGVLATPLTASTATWSPGCRRCARCAIWRLATTTWTCRR